MFKHAYFSLAFLLIAVFDSDGQSKYDHEFPKTYKVILDNKGWLETYFRTITFSSANGIFEVSSDSIKFSTNRARRADENFAYAISDLSEVFKSGYFFVHNPYFLPDQVGFKMKDKNQKNTEFYIFTWRRREIVAVLNELMKDVNSSQSDIN